MHSCLSNSSHSATCHHNYEPTQLKFYIHVQKSCLFTLLFLEKILLCRALTFMLLNLKLRQEFLFLWYHNRITFPSLFPSRPGCSPSIMTVPVGGCRPRRPSQPSLTTSKLALTMYACHWTSKKGSHTGMQQAKVQKVDHRNLKKR